MGRIDERLAELSITLTDPPAPAGAYVPAIVDGHHVLTSGQLPLVDGALPVTGHVGAEVDPEQAKEMARLCAINALAAIRGAIGDLDRVEQVVKVVGFVSSAPDFTGQPGVINGASELLGEVFGAAGEHARSAVGVAALPLGTPVEVEVTVRIRD
ncbi:MULTISPECIES: RidA family protein [Janibacter]|uniref:Enamine deaminase RidA, house cleaning of reactive enamine intermediates, YjgF/YER057c/UK114 family n=1 Tax=Janibacter indicus TaxID=857417 RepID=A0A1W2DAT4_9MICO|nr:MULTISPECIES: RidA family protein [Janibacter]QNF93757.1 RidA family protein [Janibacter sp. YB324]SMC94483.1 Enamine deaminase RidA, house cleaning of reactive enamine intermediates, YjgF/YER057c/UK114 family [Janibacter indicus]